MNKNTAKNKFKIEYYAQALFNLAAADNDFEQVEEELRQVKDAIVYNLDLKKYLSDPSIRQSERINALLEITGKDFSGAIKAFSAMIIILNLEEYLEQIFQDYIKLINQFKQQILISVISAIKLEDDMLAEIKKDVDLKTGLDVRIKNIIDKAIIGGIVIKIGERVIDLSIKNKIDDMRQKLKSLELKGEYFGTEN